MMEATAWIGKEKETGREGVNGLADWQADWKTEIKTQSQGRQTDQETDGQICDNDSR